MSNHSSPSQDRSQDAAAMERLSRFKKAAELSQERERAPHSNAILVVAIALSAMGSLLLVCALALTCAPASPFAKAVLSFWSTVLKGV